MALTADERCYIEGELAKTKAITSGVVEAIVIVNDEMAQLRDQSYETMAEVRSAADKLILEIRSHEQKLLDKVAEILEWKEACLQKQKKTLEDFLEELQQSIDYTSDALNKPNNQDIDEWKIALIDHLLSLQNMKEDYTSKPDIYDGSGFVFLYENEQILRSVASYGSIVNDAKHTFDRKEGESLSGIPVMPIITLNGLIVDLVEEEKKSYDNSETDDDDDDDDDDESDSSNEESDTGQSDDDDDDDDDDDNKEGKDDKSTKRQKRIHATYDDDDDDGGGGGVKNNDGTVGARKKDTDEQKIGESISNSKTNRGLKLSTLL